jgi:hypothetical protein
MKGRKREERKEGKKEKKRKKRSPKRKKERKEKERRRSQKKNPQIGTLLPPANSSPPTITTPTRQPVSSCHRQNSPLTHLLPSAGPGSGL